MIGIMSLLLPAGLAAYFLYQAIRRPIFLLGIPFLQVMARSVFFWDLRPFRMPVALGTNGVVLMWMVAAWLWCVFHPTADVAAHASASDRRSRRLLPEEYLLVALAVLILAKVLWGGIAYSDTSVVLGQFAPWGLLLGGYFFVRGAVRRSSTEDVAALVTAVAVASGIASVLFIIHQGLGVTIYDIPAYQVITFQGQKLTRTYWFMSPFLLMTLGVGAALVMSRVKGSLRVGAVALVVVSLVAVMVSYTRNYVLSAAVVIVALVILRWIKEPSLGILFRRSSLAVIVLGLAVAVMVIAMPGPTNFLMQRLASLTQVSTVTGDQNYLVRQSDLRTVTATTYRDNWLAGAPFGVADDMAAKVDEWTPDSMWVGVLYWTGYAGVVIVGLLFALYGWRACRLFMDGSGSAEFLAAVLFAAIVALFVNSLSGWGFLDQSVYAMGFWLFAFVAGEVVKARDVGLEAHAAAGRRDSAGLQRDLEAAS